MMKKLALLSLLLVFMIGLGSSQTEVQTLGGIDGFAPGEEVNLTQICTNCTFVNITYVVLASRVPFKIDQEMTKDGTFYNYSLPTNVTTSVGEYIVNWVADPDGELTSGNFNFFVRNNATFLTTAESALYIFLALFNMAAVVFFLFHGFTIPYNDHKNEEGTLTRIMSSKYLKLLSIWLGYGASLWLLGIITAITNNFISLESTSSLMTNLYLFVYILGYPLTFVILGIIMIEVYRDIFRELFKKFFMSVIRKVRVN